MLKKGAPLSIFGIVHPTEQRIDYQISIPNALSLLAFGNIHAEVQGLESVPHQDRPNISVVFQTYHLMILCWALMVGIVGYASWYLWKQSLLAAAKLLKILASSVVIPQIGNQAGWVAAEMGRYPWAVHGLLRISEGVSRTVSVDQIVGSIFLFLCWYTGLFVLYFYLVLRAITTRPERGALP